MHLRRGRRASNLAWFLGGFPLLSGGGRRGYCQMPFAPNRKTPEDECVVFSGPSVLFWHQEPLQPMIVGLFCFKTVMPLVAKVEGDNQGRAL